MNDLASSSVSNTAAALKRQFLTRAVAVLTVLAVGASAVFYGRDGWGLAAIACFAWCALGALVLGVFGFSSMRRALECRVNQMAPIMMVGLIGRVVVLAATQISVYMTIGPVWGQRTLLGTTLFYLVVLALEVHTLGQLLNRATARQSSNEEGSDSR